MAMAVWKQNFELFKKEGLDGQAEPDLDAIHGDDRAPFAHEALNDGSADHT